MSGLPPNQISANAARLIAERLRHDGFYCLTAQVRAVARGESLPEDPALESAILQELDP